MEEKKATGPSLSSVDWVKQGDRRKLKRWMDIVISVFVLVLVWPLMLLVALAIKWEDGGAVLFIQQRTGKDGHPFSIYKFRSMTEDPSGKERHAYEWSDGVPDDFLFKHPQTHDPAVTYVGRFIRKTSLDELPQLLNVLFGTMSLVGPRPEIPAITKCYNAFQQQRLQVKPGITGWAQVNGRSSMTNGKKMTMDIYYVTHQSIVLDLKILVKTIGVVFTAKGAV